MTLRVTDSKACYVYTACRRNMQLPLDPNALLDLQRELVAGESVLYTGRPSERVVFHRGDLFVVPFTLMWGGFAIFWEGGVLGFWGTAPSHGTSWFMVFWGVPFVLIGQYLIWGRFLYAAWQKRRTRYAVTNRRVIAIQEGWSRRVASAYVDSIPAIVKSEERGGIGTLSFALTPTGRTARRGWGSAPLLVGESPVFVDIEDVDGVYRLVSDLREKAHPALRS
jgi:hypothetical protein